MITTDGTSTDAAAGALRARIARIGTSIGNDARAIAAAGDAPGTRPPLAALRTTLTRLELASAAYGG
jgi:plasmid stability protein